MALAPLWRYLTGRGCWPFAAATARGTIMRLGSSNELEPADADDDDAVCVAAVDVATAGQSSTILLLNEGLSALMLSAGPIAARAIVFQADGGKVDDVGSIRRGIALEAATDADQLIEVLQA